MTQSNRYLDGINQPRSRRRKNSERQVKKSAQHTKSRGYEYETGSLPPVMVRGGMMGTPPGVSRRKKPKVRRHYDIALGVPGAEVRLPALPQISIGFRLISGAVAVALIMLLYHLLTSPIYRVEAAAVNGLNRLTSHDVNVVLDVSDELIFGIDGEKLKEKLLEAFPEFSQVSVEVDLPRAVIVTVEERQPILTWKQDNRTVLVDANGVAFPLRDQAGQAPELVIEASGPPPSIETTQIEGAQVNFIPVEMVSAILSMSAHAPQGTPIIYDQQHGLGWKDNQGWAVYFGDVHNVAMKLGIYQVLVDKLKGEGIQPALISVEYVHTPYYRLAQ